MGYMYRYHPIWWRKYHYLLAVGLDCGTQIMQTVLVFAISLPDVSFPAWWGSMSSPAVIDFCEQADAIPDTPGIPDRCFPPNSKLPAAMQIVPDAA